MTKETRVILKELKEEIYRIEKMVDELIVRETSENPKMEKQKTIVEELPTVEIEEKQLRKETTELMRELGIPASLSGYKYIREAVVLLLQDQGQFYDRQVTKGLYPDIAKKFKTTWSRVERAIRHCIEVVFVRGNMKKIEEVFSYTTSMDRGKPTNSEFLFLLADEIQNKIE